MIKRPSHGPSDRAVRADVGPANAPAVRDEDAASRPSASFGQGTGPRLTFLGGVGTVTGSKYLVEAASTRLLVDCGLFQGLKNLRLKNWAPLPVDPRSIGSVVLTHAHLDHSGYLPLLVKNGFAGKIICTEATRDLCAVLLRDSGYLQERDAEYANRHSFSKHKPALPLYTQREAESALKRFAPISFGQEHSLGDGLSLRFSPGGHILGAAIVELSCGAANIVFSGDLGRRNSATMVDPTPISRADYLIVESTYGNRKHNDGDPEQSLAEIINETAARGGSVLVPSFAVGRAQTILFHLHRLKAAKRIPGLPIYLDSPMAIDASGIFCEHLGEHKLSEPECRGACNVARYVQSVDESKSLNANPMPKVIVSASGMATGGRVLHHLKWAALDPRNTILFTGFQAAGTRGAAMVAGAPSVKIHGQEVPIRARVRNLDVLSAHADADEIMAWLGNFEGPPKMTFVTHGEPTASDSLRRRIQDELGWNCGVPELGERVVLS